MLLSTRKNNGNRMFSFLQTFSLVPSRSLLTASGQTLCDLDCIAETNLKDGDILTAVCRRGQLISGPESLASRQNLLCSVRGRLEILGKGFQNFNAIPS